MRIIIYSVEDNDTGLIYIGNTTCDTLESRMITHLRDYERYTRHVSGQSRNTRVRRLSIFPILENNNYTERVIEVYDAKDDTDVLEREGYWQKRYKDRYGELLINIRMEGKKRYQTDEEKRLYEKETKRKWRRKKYVKEVLDDIIDTIVQHHTQLIGDYSDGVWV
jgi:hypothetical protein